MGIEKKNTVSLYTNHKDCPDTDDINELNKAFNEMEINCKVLLDVGDDGYTLVFQKEDI